MDYEHDIAISYAGEDEEIALELALALSERGIKVFNAFLARPSVIGEDMEQVFARTYSASSRFVAVLVSEFYAVKKWTRFELDIAGEEEDRRAEAFIIPLVLANVRIEQIPANKAALDLRVIGVEKAAEALAEKVKRHRGELAPRDVFEEAYQEWKFDGLVPGFEESDLFFKGVAALRLDGERCAFLLRCPSRMADTRKRALAQIDPDLLLEAGKLLFNQAEHPGERLAAIGYIGFAVPLAAEPFLRQIFEDESQEIYDRGRAFAELWKCDRDAVPAESHAVLLNRDAPWPLRVAAARNVLWGPLTEATEEVLRQALADPRQAVRTVVVDAIIKFRLQGLTPELMKAYEKDRSRKGRERIKWALRHSNEKPEVVEFAERMGFGRAFFKSLPYIHDWEKSREEWI